MGLTALMLLLVLWPASAAAHEGDTRLRLNRYEISPGQQLEVSGINLGTDLVVQVYLTGRGRSIFLGEAHCDGHGDFIKSFGLPENLEEDIYTIQIIDPTLPDRPVVMADTKIKISAAALTGSNPQLYTFPGESPGQLPSILWGVAMAAGLGLLFIMTGFLFLRNDSKQV